MQLFSRKDGESIGIMMEKEIEIPVEIFLTVVSEMDLFYLLIPDVKESR